MDDHSPMSPELPAEIAAALDASAEDILHGRVSDVQELLNQAEERLRALWSR